MKIAAVVDRNNYLKPLDQGERIVILEENGERKIFNNPGFGFRHGGKEKAMEVILKSQVEAVVAKEAFLCPCSYDMSFGKLKYVITKADTVDELLEKSAELTIRSELDPRTYAEDEHHHHGVKGSRTINARLS